MGLPTSLSDRDRVVVADTSTIINLNATGCAADILTALPYRVVAVDVVRDELENGRAKGRSDASKFAALVAANLIDVVVLGSDGLNHFEGLVIGAASETLDDGEAATIAYATEADAVALIDEHKAIRLCASRFPKLRLGSTVDLFAHPSVRSALGISGLADAVHRALIDARMRVMAHHVAGVVALIGSERAARCPSLPRTARMLSPSRDNTGKSNVSKG
jgi:predicted nucleic acid-binding protein